MDTKLVNAAVKIELMLQRGIKSKMTIARLQADLDRLNDSMTPEERFEFIKRTT
jgi:hypothetical protein